MGRVEHTSTKKRSLSATTDTEHDDMARPIKRSKVPFVKKTSSNDGVTRKKVQKPASVARLDITAPKQHRESLQVDKIAHQLLVNSNKKPLGQGTQCDSGYGTLSSSSHSSEEAAAPTGLYNPTHQSCYANAVLQGVSRCIDARDLKRNMSRTPRPLQGLSGMKKAAIFKAVKNKKKHEVSIKAECLRLIKKMQASSEEAVNPLVFQRVFGKSDEVYNGSTQEDAALFLGKLLDQLSGDEVDGELKFKDNAFLDSNFKTESAGRKTCNNCGHVSLAASTKSWILELETDFTADTNSRNKKAPTEHTSLGEMMEKKLSTTDCVDDFRCEECGKHGITLGWAGIQSLAKTTIVQFPRSRLNKYGGAYKLAYEVELPSHYTFIKDDASSRRELVAVVKHDGFTMNKGHFVAYVKTPAGQWYLCNDAEVTEAAFEDVNSHDMGHTYLAFYKK
ncbi:cysteine proteinase [Lophium mytilinum]|uniref:Cysteine proteinase n=1 Tax=Lophium mytilinum TaxID=390894 RepID=A0A6A6RBR1_9PEZI|nr:cysteine proteinase [Lophium mytilinum]